MAIAEVASKRVSGASNDAVAAFAAETFPGGVTAGDFLVVAGAAWGSSAAPTSIAVTDTRTTAYTVVLAAVAGSLTWRTFIAYGFAPSTGANAVTVNPAGADGTHSGSFSLDAFTGVHATPTDVDGGSSSGTFTNGAPFTGSDDLTTGTAGALLIGVLSHDRATEVLSAGASHTTIGGNDSNSGNQCHHAVFRLATTATTYTVAINGAGAVGNQNPGWVVQTYAFKEAAEVGPTEGFVLVAN